MEFSRNNILKRLRAALDTPTNVPYPTVQNDTHIFAQPRETHLDILFAEEFKALGGIFIYCESHEMLQKHLTQLIDAKQWHHIACWEPHLQKLLTSFGIPIQKGTNLSVTEVGVTSCEALIARTGSVVLSSEQSHGRAVSIFPPAHFVIAYTSQVVHTLKDVLSKYADTLPSASMWSIISGASRTADIEKTLVMGAHGSKEIYVFLVESN